jgi:hypothetical protein
LGWERKIFTNWFNARLCAYRQCLNFSPYGSRKQEKDVFGLAADYFLAIFKAIKKSHRLFRQSFSQNVILRFSGALLEISKEKTSPGGGVSICLSAYL